MTQLSGGDLQFGTSRSGGIQAPRTGIDQQLNAPGVTPIGPTEGGVSRLAQAVQGILGASIGAGGQLQQTMHNERVKQVEAEMNVAYEHFLKGEKNPAFNTKEAQDFFFKLEGQQEQTAFDVNSVQSNPGESDGAALARTIEERYAGMPTAFRAQLYEGVIPKMAEKRAREVMIEQKRAVADSLSGVGKALVDNNPEAGNMYEAGKALFLSKGGTEQQYAMETAGKAISTIAISGDPNSLAKIKHLDEKYGVSNIDAEAVARDVATANSTLARVAGQANAKAIDQINGQTSPLQIEAIAHKFHQDGVIDNADLNRAISYAGKVRENQARGAMANMTAQERLKYLNGNGARAFNDPIELSKLRQDALNNAQASNADAITDRMIQAKPGMQAEAAKSAMDALGAAHSRYLKNNNDPTGINGDQYMSGRGRIMSLNAEKASVNERRQRVTEMLGSTDRSGFVLTGEDAPYISEKMFGGALSGHMDKNGNPVVESVNIPWSAAKAYNQVGIQDMAVAQSVARGLNQGGVAKDMEKGIEYGYALYLADPNAPGTSPNYTQYREKLTPAGQARFDAAVAQLDVKHPTFDSPEWAARLKEVSLSASNVDTTFRMSATQARELWTGKAKSTDSDIIGSITSRLNTQDITDDWTRRWTSGGVAISNDYDPGSVIGLLELQNFAGGRKFILESNQKAVEMFGRYTDEAVMRGLPIEKAKDEAYNRLLGSNPPGVWNGEVTMQFGAPYVFTQEHEKAMFNDLMAWDKATLRNMGGSHYKAFCRLQWDAKAEVKDPSGSGKNIQGGFVLFDTTTQEPVGGRQRPFIWRPASSKTETHTELTKRLTKEASDLRYQEESLMFSFKSFKEGASAAINKILR